MARTTASLTPQPQPNSSTPTKDPWDIEHENSLRRVPNAICHSDTLYTGIVHKGFDADATAEELIRRYPPFQEAEEHRKFLVRSISERFIIPGEKDDYFTPEQLWDEDDRVNGKRVFSKDDAEGSDDQETDDEEADGATDAKEGEQEPVIMTAVPRGEIGEDEIESDEQLAQLLSDPVEPKESVEDASLPSADQEAGHVEMADEDLAELFGEGPEAPVIVVTTLEPEPETPKVEENVVETGDDSELPVTLQGNDHATTITFDYPGVQRTLASLDLSPETTVAAVTHISVDGSLVLAVSGSRASHSKTGNDSSRPIEVDDNAASHSESNEQQPSIENAADSKEWNIAIQCPHRHTAAFLSGPKTYGALMAEIHWDTDTIVATTVSYSDGRVLVLMVGEQKTTSPSAHEAYDDQADPADRFNDFFGFMRKHSSIPAEHSELASLLQIAHMDMIEAGTLATSTLAEDATDSSEGESEITTTTQSVSHSSKRMRFILQQPIADHIHFSHVDSRQQPKLASPGKENHLPSGPPSTKNRLQVPQVSGFPAVFGKIDGNVKTTAGPKAKPAPPTRKRRRAPSVDVNNENDDDDEYIRTPQRKRKVAKVIASTNTTTSTKPRGRGRPRKNVQAPTKKTQPMKKQVHKATTAAESAQSIAEVRARLATFKVAISSGDDSSASPEVDGQSGGGMREESVPMGESEGEESEEE